MLARDPDEAPQRTGAKHYSYFKISVYWELNRDTGKYLVQFSVDDLSHVLSRYARSKAFLRVDGKPVLFAYEHVESQASLAALMDIVESTRAKAGDFILIGHGYRSSLAYFFDGLHTDYSHIPWRALCNPTEENFAELRQAAARYFAEGAQMSRRQGRIVCPMIIPGFDNGKSSSDPVRAPEAFGRDIFLPSLCQFISTRLKAVQPNY